MESKAVDLQEELRPPIEGEKTLLLKMTPGNRPEVIFTGLWSGKYIKAAMDSIAKCYRVARRQVIRTTNKVSDISTQQSAEGRK